MNLLQIEFVGKPISHGLKKNLQCSLTSLLVVFSCLTRITACPHLMRCQLKIMDVHTQQISLNRHALFSAFGLDTVHRVQALRQVFCECESLISVLHI